MMKGQNSVDSALNSNGSSSASLESHLELVASESSKVAPITTMKSSVTAELNEVSSTTKLRPINNGSIQNSAIKRFWTFLFNQLLLWVTLGSPKQQVGSRRIQLHTSKIALCIEFYVL